MWAIIYTICVAPLLMTLLLAGRRASRLGMLNKYKSPFERLGFVRLAIALFWQLDVIGIILCIAVFALILVPFTIAGGETSKWKEGHIIAPLVVGLLCVPAFVLWEMQARHPLVPFKLLRDRGVWAALGIACFLNFAWYLQGE
jgi:SIT family siderophore-iron:H+ symporter-like MFS transporter